MDNKIFFFIGMMSRLPSLMKGLDPQSESIWKRNCFRYRAMLYSLGLS